MNASRIWEKIKFIRYNWIIGLLKLILSFAIIVRSSVYGNIFVGVYFLSFSFRFYWFRSSCVHYILQLFILVTNLQYFLKIILMMYSSYFVALFCFFLYFLSNCILKIPRSISLGSSLLSSHRIWFKHFILFTRFDITWD